MPMDRSKRQREARYAPNSPASLRRTPLVKVAAGRSLRDFLPLLSGEQALLQACQRGEVARLSTTLPEAANDMVRVRAAFLRFLLLGGDDQAPVHERGVRLAGAYVEGRLDLAGCRIPHNVDLKHCRFTDQLFAQDARVAGLMTLEGSYLPQGADADRLQCDGGLFLRGGFKTAGEVRLLGAQIGGNLECRGGQFEVEKGDALRCRLIARSSKAACSSLTDSIPPDLCGCWVCRSAAT